MGRNGRTAKEWEIFRAEPTEQKIIRVVECWSTGSITPLLHYSNTPFRFGSMRAWREKISSSGSRNPKYKNHVAVPGALELARFSHAEPASVRAQRMRVIARHESDTDLEPPRQFL